MPKKWNETFDVVVIGAVLQTGRGLRGEKGRRLVVVLEKMRHPEATPLSTVALFRRPDHLCSQKGHQGFPGASLPDMLKAGHKPEPRGVAKMVAEQSRRPSSGPSTN
jgi:hypothetical protein